MNEQSKNWSSILETHIGSLIRVKSASENNDGTQLTCIFETQGLLTWDLPDEPDDKDYRVSSESSTLRFNLANIWDVHIRNGELEIELEYKLT